MIGSELDRLYKEEVVKDYLREAENDRLSRKAGAGKGSRRLLGLLLVIVLAVGVFAAVLAIENGANVVALAR